MTLISSQMLKEIFDVDALKWDSCLKKTFQYFETYFVCYVPNGYFFLKSKKKSFLATHMKGIYFYFHVVLFIMLYKVGGGGEGG